MGSLIRDLRRAVEIKEGFPRFPTDSNSVKIWMMYAGKQLNQDWLTLADYSIRKESTIHIILPLKGMTSNFSEYDESDPLTECLLNNRVDKITEDLLEKKREELKGSEISRIKLDYTGSELMDYWRRQKLIGVANFVHAMQQIDGKSQIVLQDIKIVFPPGCIDKISGIKVEDTLKSYFVSEGRSAVKFVIRRTSATIGCIPWHVDGPYSNCVVQYTLNDDKHFKGGRLYYFSKDAGLFCPSRPAGTVTVHRKEMHAVTRLVSGVRYVLFVVDESNGLGFNNTENIVRLTESKVDQIIAEYGRMERLDRMNK